MAGIDSFTKLYLAGGEADASTTILDSSLSPKTVSAFGNAQADTAQSKFTSSSVLLDGSGDYLTVPDSTDWDIDASGTFTVDGWFRPPAGQTENYLIGQQDHSNLNNGGWCILVRNPLDATTIIIDIQNVGLVVTGTYDLTGGTWYHLAFERTATTAYLYRSGTIIGSAANAVATSSSTALGIGQQIATGTKDTTGHMAGWRVSKGIARYGGANFTPPTAVYTADVTARASKMMLMGIG